VDLDSGEYRVRVAGHPPALHYRPGTPSPWRTSEAAGTVLGALPTVTGVLDRDVLRPGEALFLYTDGVVEDRAAGLEAGTRRLMGSVEALAAERPGGAGLAGLLIEQVPSTLADDRTLVVIQRQPAGRPTATPPAGHRGAGRLLPVGS
jgi:serine phosphatase RsbU (regulator of sigma subunit)